MALREIRQEGDDILHKTSKPVKEINDKIITLLDDMIETMKKEDGLGLAAPQVGVLRRVVIIDTGEGGGLVELINPEIVETEGEQQRKEGCLSVPGKSGIVKRPQKTKVRAFNRRGEIFFIEGEGLQSVALNHELDHLDGVLFTDKALRILTPEEEEEEDEKEETAEKRNKSR